MMLLPEVSVAHARSVISVGLTSAWLGVGYDVLRSRDLSLAALVGVHVGALHAAVLQGDPGAPGDHLWAAGLVAVRFRARLVGPLAAEVGVEGYVPFVRHRFFDGTTRDTVFQQPFAAASAFAGVGLQFR